MYWRGYKLFLSLSLSTITVRRCWQWHRMRCIFYGHFDGHRTMHSQHQEHQSIAKAHGNNIYPGQWLSRLRTLALVAKRSAWIFFSCFLGFWLVVFLGFVLKSWAFFHWAAVMQYLDTPSIIAIDTVKLRPNQEHHLKEQEQGFLWMSNLLLET